MAMLQAGSGELERYSEHTALLKGGHLETEFEHHHQIRRVRILDRHNKMLVTGTKKRERDATKE